MESLLSDKWDVQHKHAPEEVLQRWRGLCGVVKNHKRRFRFTANLSKRYEAAAMRKTNHVTPSANPISFFNITIKCSILIFLFLISGEVQSGNPRIQSSIPVPAR